ncbi:hypothetical protein LIER_28580 [Lithospermum erythrorhizon]|uniref:Retrovirus-related Pol polyprotein from transposon TNT 1-94-like beta-barrel domain-containing protein n=1 Tax=Lithospermum erythrorhizon TaxID=34254 RepID=A0AAV3RJX4_LITER
MRFLKVGYPDWWETSNRRVPRIGAAVGNRGRFQRSCPLDVLGSVATFDESLWATVHATGTLACLVHHFHDVSYPLMLPDGRVIRSTRQGTVMLSASLTLRDVLYVPNLNCNLISVSQLLAQHCCDILFTHNLCSVQD